MSVFFLLTLLICSAYAVLMLSYLIGWEKTPPFPSLPPIKEREERVRCSIIIPARNEEENILKVLGCLYKQTYPLDMFEIIVVDDNSSDRTAELVSSLNISNLKLVQLSEPQAGKKHAITEGIKNATGNLIITTDADCEMRENWLSSIASFYEKYNPKMIIAPVLLKDEKTIPEIFQSQEMAVLAASACASLHYNLPILCSAANLCYEKEAFHAVNGFEEVDKTATGDDIFLMLKVHKKFPGGIRYLKSKDAIVCTNPEKKVSSVISQRKRWASKSFSYGFSYITLIAVLVFFTNFLIFLSAILCAINSKFALAFAVTLPIKCMVDYMLLHSASSFFGKKIHPLIFILASISYPAYVSLIGFISPFTSYSWKGRKNDPLLGPGK